MITILTKYFPDLSIKQLEQFEQLGSLYPHWNEQINVISRKDIDSLYLKHILHSLSIAKFTNFKSGTSVLDIGTGGGFPGIPLAILYPECHFTLVDSVGKKIKVVNEISKAIGLQNVEAIHGRAEKVKDQYDFIVSRAVTSLDQFKYWIKGKSKKIHKNYIKNGVIYLKGGDLTEEIKKSGIACKVFPINKYFEEDFFETKSIVYWKTV